MDLVCDRCKMHLECKRRVELRGLRMTGAKGVPLTSLVDAA